MVAKGNEPERLEVSVRGDKMEVAIRFTDRSGKGSLPTIDEVLCVVNRARVIVTNEVKAAIVQYAEKQLRDPVKKFQKAIIAKGRRVEDGREAKLTWDEAVAPKTRKEKKKDGRADHYAFGSVILVAPDTFLGTIVPAVPACAGVNVLGTAVQPRSWCKDIELHKSVRAEGDNPIRIYSISAGVVRFLDNELRVDETVEIKGDVNFATGNLICATDIAVGGAVLDNFTVKSTGTIKVTGPIQGAKVSAGKDVLANGGVLGKEIGVVKATGKIVAKFAEEADLRAKGDIVVASAIIGCHVSTRARIVAPQATVRGGRLYAHRGAEIGELGSAAAVPTRIAIGIDPKIAATALKVEDEISWIEKDIEPCATEHAKRAAEAKKAMPTSGQLRRLRQLDSEIKYLQGLIEELAEERATMLKNAQPERKPVLQITRQLQPGAEIQFGLKLATLRTLIKGPLRVEERTISNKEELVIIDNSGNVSVLITDRATKPQQETRRTMRRSRAPRSTRPPAPSVHARGSDLPPSSRRANAADSGKPQC